MDASKVDLVGRFWCAAFTFASVAQIQSRSGGKIRRVSENNLFFIQHDAGNLKTKKKFQQLNNFVWGSIQRNLILN